MDEVLKYVLNGERNLIPVRDACDLSDKFPFVKSPEVNVPQGIESSNDHITEYLDELVEKCEENCECIIE